MSRFRTIPVLNGQSSKEALLDASRVVLIEKGLFVEEAQDNYALLTLDTGLQITTSLLFKAAAKYLEGE